jgi:hypothetical protein
MAKTPVKPPAAPAPAAPAPVNEAVFEHYVWTALNAFGGGNSSHPHMQEAHAHVQACRGLGLDPMKTSRSALAAALAAMPTFHVR